MLVYERRHFERTKKTSNWSHRIVFIHGGRPRIVHPCTSFALKSKRRGLEDSYEFETSRYRHGVKLNAIT
eukprot:UN23457